VKAASALLSKGFLLLQMYCQPLDKSVHDGPISCDDQAHEIMGASTLTPSDRSTHVGTPDQSLLGLRATFHFLQTVLASARDSIWTQALPGTMNFRVQHGVSVTKSTMLDGGLTHDNRLSRILKSLQPSLRSLN
jgi:hypothetical protein